jgi:UDP-N-acetylmuramate dehydrogenase
LLNQECKFGYRDSIFKGELRGRAIITSVEFSLSKDSGPHLIYDNLRAQVEAYGQATVGNIREVICSIRRSKLPDPNELGNAGSFFKNPIVHCSVTQSLKQKYDNIPIYPTLDPEHNKLAAGWLIDKAGLKGYRTGNVGVHDKQALVLVNHGGATGGEVMALARYVQDEVARCFGIAIEPEVNIL